MVATRNGTKPATKRKTALPTRTVQADDVAITIDDEEYFIHEGDWVTFVGTNGSVAEFLASLDLMTTDLGAVKPDADGLDDEQKAATRHASEMMAETIASLRQKIVAWQWKDKRGQLLPSPPTEKDLRSLEFEELNWLLSGGKRKETPLAGESPSTSPSTA